MPEVTENYIRIPNPKHKETGCKKIRTITVSASKGIKALYCIEHKKIKTYLFDRKKWNLSEAKKWVKEHSKGINMSDKLHVKAEIKKREKKIVAVASEEVEDREGEVLSIDGWDLKNFKKNPILLWYHNLRPERSLPIGKAKNIKIQKVGQRKKLTFEPVFETITEFGRTIKKFVEDGLLNSFSVGFQPIEKEGNKYLSQELLEISLVPVAALPSAQIIERMKIDKNVAKALTGDKKAIKAILKDGDKEIDGGKLHEPSKEGEIVYATREDIKALDEKIEKLFKVVKSTRRATQKAVSGKYNKMSRNEILSLALKATAKAVDEALKRVRENKAKWTREFINNLPDAAFAYIEPGGEKDESGKTKPRSLRHFPHHGTNVRSGSENNTVDKPHLRNALARAPQSPFGPKALPHLKKHARALNIGDND